MIIASANKETAIFDSIKAALATIDENTPVTNRETAIYSNVGDTLRQLKLSGQANKRLVLDAASSECDDLDMLTVDQLFSMSLSDLDYLLADAGETCAVYFYTDSGRTELLFSDTSAANPSRFMFSGGKVYYTPSDVGLNDAAGISESKSQPVYYATALFCDGKDIKVAYRNVSNMLFQNVIFSTKKNPAFSTNDNGCIIVPGESKVESMGLSDDLSYVTVPFDIYVQLIVPDWTNLSEENRIARGNQTADLIRNALLADRYRGGNCTLKSKDLNGTQIGTWQPLPSKDVLKGVLKCQCVYQASSSSY